MPEIIYLSKLRGKHENQEAECRDEFQSFSQTSRKGLGTYCARFKNSLEYEKAVVEDCQVVEKDAYPPGLHEWDEKMNTWETIRDFVEQGVLGKIKKEMKKIKENPKLDEQYLEYKDSKLSDKYTKQFVTPVEEIRKVARFRYEKRRKFGLKKAYMVVTAMYDGVVDEDKGEGILEQCKTLRISREKLSTTLGKLCGVHTQGSLRELQTDIIRYYRPEKRDGMKAKWNLFCEKLTWKKDDKPCPTDKTPYVFWSTEQQFLAVCKTFSSFCKGRKL